MKRININWKSIKVQDRPVHERGFLLIIFKFGKSKGFRITDRDCMVFERKLAKKMAAIDHIVYNLVQENTVIHPEKNTRLNQTFTRLK